MPAKSGPVAETRPAQIARWYKALRSRLSASRPSGLHLLSLSSRFHCVNRYPSFMRNSCVLWGLLRLLFAISFATAGQWNRIIQARHGCGVVSSVYSPFPSTSVQSPMMSTSYPSRGSHRGEDTLLQSLPPAKVRNSLSSLCILLWNTSMCLPGYRGRLSRYLDARSPHTPPASPVPLTTGRHLRIVPTISPSYADHCMRV